MEIFETRNVPRILSRGSGFPSPPRLALAAFLCWWARSFLGSEAGSAGGWGSGVPAASAVLCPLVKAAFPADFFFEIIDLWNSRLA